VIRNPAKTRKQDSEFRSAKIRSSKSEIRNKSQIRISQTIRRLGGFEFRVSDFEFTYMPYMVYMVEKAAVPSALSLQPVFLTMKGMKKQICGKNNLR